VRGDSLRDFYAKTLALIGLGLLGGIGALVDYWPAGIAVPAVSSSGVAMPAPLSARTIDDAVDLPAFPVRSDVPARAARASAPIAPPATSPPAPLSLAEPVAMASASPTAIALAAPPPPPLLEPRPASAVMADAAFGPAAVLDLPPQPASLPVTTLAATGFGAVTLSESSIEDDGGFFSDAGDIARKAGSTIVSGTMKAGAPIVGMARLLGGAFRKITPFKD
jgi:hypothetical protein